MLNLNLIEVAIMFAGVVSVPKYLLTYLNMALSYQKFNRNNWGEKTNQYSLLYISCDPFIDKALVSSIETVASI